MRHGRWGLQAFLLFFVIASVLAVKPVAAEEDFTGPTVSVARLPVEPPPGIPVNVTVTVVDEYGLIGLNFTYTANSSVPIATKMHLSRGDDHNGTYLFTIPGLPLTSNVSYYATAWDTLGYVRNTTSGYTVKNDSSPPFTETAPHVMLPSYLVLYVGWDRIAFSTTLADLGTGTRNVSLQFLFNPEYPFNFSDAQSMAMNLTSGNKYNGEYECSLPPQENETVIRYRVVARDWAGNMLTTNDYYFGGEIPPPSAYWTLQIGVVSIDLVADKANLTVFFSGTFASPDNPDSIPMFVYAWVGPHLVSYLEVINIERVFQPSFYQFYSSLQIPLEGLREFYPFDSYQLNLTFQLRPSLIAIQNINRPFVQRPVSVFMYGSLFPQWSMPLYQNSTSLSYEGLSINVIMEFSRLPSTVNLNVLLPIFASFLLLGFTALIDVGKKLSDRLVVYLTLFVFASGFFAAATPVASSAIGLTLAQLLIISLFVSVVSFSILSVLSGTIGKGGKPAVLRSVICDGIAVDVSVLATTAICNVQTFSRSYSLFGLNSVFFALVVGAIFVGWVVELVRDRRCFQDILRSNENTARNAVQSRGKPGKTEAGSRKSRRKSMKNMKP